MAPDVVVVFLEGFRFAATQREAMAARNCTPSYKRAGTCRVRMAAAPSSQLSLSIPLFLSSLQSDAAPPVAGCREVVGGSEESSSRSKMQLCAAAGCRPRPGKWLDERRNALRLYYCRTLFCFRSWREEDMGRRARGGGRPRRGKRAMSGNEWCVT